MKGASEKIKNLPHSGDKEEGLNPSARDMMQEAQSSWVSNEMRAVGESEVGSKENGKSQNQIQAGIGTSLGVRRIVYWL